MTATSSLDAVRALLRTRSAILADVEPAGERPERLLVRANLSGTMQLSQLRDGDLVALTALPEPVGGARYLPGSRRAVLEIDRRGNERHQLYLLDLDAAARLPVRRMDQLHALTCEAHCGHRLAGVSPDGRQIAYLSNRANGVDFDLWICDLPTETHRCCWASGAFCQPGSGFSPDGRLVSVLRPGERPLDLDLVLVDVGTGEARIMLEHPHQAALVGPPAWVGDTAFYAASNAGGEFCTIVRHDATAGTSARLPGVGEQWDAEVLASADQSTLLVIENRDGASRMRLHDAATGAPGAPVPVPEPGVVSSHSIDHPRLSADGSRVYYTLSTPRLAGDVFVHDARSGETRRLTSSPAELPADELVSPESARVASFDGEEIPLLVFRPRSEEPRPPVVVVVHGGPESQAMRSFNPEIQGLVLAGYAVVAPNVRGSTGYGKRYAALDDTTRRLDAVRDLRAVHGFLGAAGLDPERAALWGGSYGGYMVLAGLAFQPDLWAAGVDIVGISDLVTFLQNTADYRRAHREREYGSLRGDRAFLAEASPLRHADAIRAPLFVIHGLNDPRVPVGEARQLVDNLRRRGIPCALTVYEDEGHGLARLANRLDAYPRAIAFLDDVLGR